MGKVIHAPFGRAHEMFSYYMHGFSVAEIAAIFGTTSRIVRAEIERYVRRLNNPGGVK